MTEQERALEQRIVETFELCITGTASQQLRAALQEAEELERRGHDWPWDGAWRDTDDWHRFIRLSMLLGFLSKTAEKTVKRDTRRWRERHRRKKTIYLVK